MAENKEFPWLDPDCEVTREIVERDVIEIIYNKVLGTTCPKCGSWLKSKNTLKFCPYCGSRFVIKKEV